MNLPMAMTQQSTIDAMIQQASAEETDLVRSEVPALEAITRSEIAMQLDAAHRYPRSVSKFLLEAKRQATQSVAIAEMCFYSLPRRGDDGEQKMIQGPSIRLAEICATNWGNLHVGARIVDETERSVIAQGVCWDLESNYRTTVEISRPVLNRFGRRYQEHMIETVRAAAISFAYRNALSRVIPRAYVQALLEACKATAVGDAETFGARRDDVLARLAKMGVPQERVFQRIEIKGLADLTAEHLATLIGLGTAIRQNEITIDEAFPTPAPAVVSESTPEGKRVKLPGKGKANDNETG